MAKRKKVEDYLADFNNVNPKIKIRALKVLGKSGSVDSHIVSCIIPLLKEEGGWKIGRLEGWKTAPPCAAPPPPPKTPAAPGNRI